MTDDQNPNAFRLVRADFEVYLDGFLPNVRDILALERESEGLLGEIVGEAN